MPKRYNPREYVAGRINAAMKEQGVSLRDLAERSGVPASSLSRYLRGLTSPTLDHLAAIAGALDASLADFMPERAA